MSAPRARRKRWGAGVGLAGVAREELVALSASLVGESPIPHDTPERLARRWGTPGGDPSAPPEAGAGAPAAPADGPEAAPDPPGPGAPRQG